MATLPAWAEEMRSLYRSGSTSQFILSGNVADLVNAPGADGAPRFVSLRAFLTEVMLQPFDVVLHYDRGRGIRVRRGGEHFYSFLKAFDAYQGTSWATLPDAGKDSLQTLDLGNLLPRDPGRALELINRFMRGSQMLTRVGEDGVRVADPLKVAVVVDYAHFIAPRGEPIHFSGELAQNLILLLDWASDPALTGAAVATVLITDNLSDLHPVLVENPYAAKLKIDLPGAAVALHSLTALVAPGMAVIGAEKRRAAGRALVEVGGGSWATGRIRGLSSSSGGVRTWGS